MHACAISALKVLIDCSRLQLDVLPYFQADHAESAEGKLEGRWGEYFFGKSISKNESCRP